MVEEVALRCRGCDDTYIGTTLKGIVDKAPEGQLPLGFCPSCNVKLDEEMKEFGRTYNGSAPEPKGSLDTSYQATDSEPEQGLSFDDDDQLDMEGLDLSPDSIPMSDELRQELEALRHTDEQERFTDERDEYWR